MILEKLHENVYYYKNVIEDPRLLVSKIEETENIKSIHNVFIPWNEWSACSGQMYVYGEKKDLMVDELDKLSGDDLNIAKDIIDEIRNGFTKVCQDWKLQKNISDDVNLSPYIGINKYKEGTFMGTHFDQQEGDSRLKYSLVMYLNDDYEGGEVSFSIKEGVLTSTDNAAKGDIEDDHNKDVVNFFIKPEAGSCIIFPSSPPYSHTAHLVKSGWKYMIPGFWMEKGM